MQLALEMCLLDTQLESSSEWNSVPKPQTRMKWVKASNEIYKVVFSHCIEIYSLFGNQFHLVDGDASEKVCAVSEDHFKCF